MSEFISHEGQIAIARSGKSDEPYHLMQGNASVNNRRMAFLVHGGVHCRIHQAEGYRLVSHHRLVVTFGIADCLLVFTFVGELPPHFSHAPALVRKFLDPFYPVVGNSHAHSEVKSDSAGLERRRKTGHSAHILSNRESVLVHLVDEDVG